MGPNRRAAASAYFHTRVADIVLGLIDERLGAVVWWATWAGLEGFS